MESLPNYAKYADRGRLVRLLCKGSCSSTQWAEMEQPYPGSDALKKAQVDDYTARCLKCGKIARDPYNWFR